MNRRELLLAGAPILGAFARTRGMTVAGSLTHRDMTIACFIRYQIDPYQRAEFQRYAETWGGSFPAAADT